MESVYCIPWLRRESAAARAGHETWLAAARLGDPGALEQFYTTYRPAVYALCHRMTDHSEDAEDVTQATFIRAFRELPRFRGESMLKTWVFRIAVNESLTLRRRKRTTCELTEESANVSDGTPGVVENLAVRAALSRLSTDHRAVLVLRFWEGFQGPEIAQILGISVPAVKMRLHRAREEFRKCYENP